MIGALLAAAILAAVLAWRAWSRRSTVAVITASGSIEATSVDLAPKVAGRVVDLRVKDGDRVERGQAVALLDGVEQRHALERAEGEAAQDRAALSQARAALNQQRAAQRASELQSAATLESVRVRVPQAVVNERLQRDTVRAQIDQARAQVRSAAALVHSAQAGVRSAAAAFESARVTLSRARADRARYERLWAQGFITAQQIEEAVAAESTALEQVNATRSDVVAAQAKAVSAAHLRDQADFALAAARASQESIAARRYDVMASEAQAIEARAALALTRASRLLTLQRQREVQAAIGKLRQSEAQVRQARANLGYTVLTAPFRGVVLTHSVEVGDLVTVGSTVVTIGDLDHPYLRVFVSERDVGRVRLGEPADVTVDAWPGRVFRGRVDEIRDRAEYTLGNVQTQEERVKLVFGVRILLDNPDWALKPGLPADAVLGGAPP